MTRRAFHFCFLRGFRQNLDEFEVWRKTKAGFLAPTFLTLGIVNIQKFQAGKDFEETNSEDRLEVSELLDKISKVTWGRVRALDPHCFSPPNWKKTPSGYILVDYGRGNEGGFNFPALLIKWHKEIATVLCRPPKQ